MFDKLIIFVENSREFDIWISLLKEKSNSVVDKSLVGNSGDEISNLMTGSLISNDGQVFRPTGSDGKANSNQHPSPKKLARHQNSKSRENLNLSVNLPKTQPLSKSKNSLLATPNTLNTMTSSSVFETNVNSLTDISSRNKSSFKSENTIVVDKNLPMKQSVNSCDSLRSVFCF